MKTLLYKAFAQTRATTPGQVYMLGILAFSIEARDDPCPSTRLLSKMSLYTQVTVIKHLRELENLGLLGVEGRKDPTGRNLSNRYTLLLD